MSETNGTPPSGFAQKLKTKTKLNDEGLREYAQFKARHAQLVDDFSILLHHTVLRNRIPVEVIINLDVDAKGQTLLSGVRIGTDNMQTSEAQDKWLEILAAADKDFIDHPALREAIHERLYNEAMSAGEILAERVRKGDRVRADARSFPFSSASYDPHR